MPRTAHEILLLAAILAAILLPVSAAESTPSVTPTSPDTDTDVHFFLPGNGTTRWDFGDGNTSQQNPAVHRYAMAGLYTIQVQQGNATPARLDVLVRIPARLYVNGTATASATHPTVHKSPTPQSLLVSQAWIIPVLLLLVAGVAFRARHVLQKRSKPLPIAVEDLEPIEPDSPAVIDLDKFVPLPPESASDDGASNESTSREQRPA